MRKFIILLYFSLSWPLFSHLEHTTFLPLVSSPLAELNPLTDLNPLAESNLPSTQRIKDSSFQKSLFPLSRALRPFTSVSALKKPTKIIQPKYDFRTVVLDLTQAEFGRQEEGVFLIWPRWFGTNANATYVFIDSIDSTPWRHICRPTSYRDLNFRNSSIVFFYLPINTHFSLLLIHFGSRPFILLLLHILYKLRCFPVYVLSHILFYEAQHSSFGLFRSIYKFATLLVVSTAIYCPMPDYWVYVVPIFWLFDPHKHWFRDIQSRSIYGASALNLVFVVEDVSILEIPTSPVHPVHHPPSIISHIALVDLL